MPGTRATPCRLAVVAASLALASVLTTAAVARAAPGLSALATGRSARPAASWRLEGRRLTIRLARPLAPGRGARRARVAIRCGDSAVDTSWYGPYTGIYLLADSAERTLRVATGVRTVRARLSRDVARVTNFCALDWAVGPDRFGYLDADMVVRHGPPRDCAAGSREQVLARSEHVLVTGMSVNDPGGMDGFDAYRACLLPHGPMWPLDGGGSSGGAGGSTITQENFTIAGDWIAWSTDYSPHGGEPGSQHIQVENLAERTATHERHDRFPATSDGAPGYASIASLALAHDGSAAWLHIAGDSTQLNARSAGGAVRTLDAGPAGALTGVTISQDGTTVSWQHSGLARSTPLR
jgi:hypothetical protein